VPGALLDFTGALLDFTKEIFTNIKKSVRGVAGFVHSLQKLKKVKQNMFVVVT